MDIFIYIDWLRDTWDPEMHPGWHRFLAKFERIVYWHSTDNRRGIHNISPKYDHLHEVKFREDNGETHKQWVLGEYPSW